MSVIKSLSVGHGDMFYIRHNTDNFTVIDCCLPSDREEELVDELINQSRGKGLWRLVSTHPDEDHIRGLPYLDSRMTIRNFYCVENSASKDPASDAFEYYCALRDGSAAFHIYKGCSRKWMNLSDDVRSSAGLTVLWPNRNNAHYRYALSDAANGVAFNNMCPVIRYSLENGMTCLWIGDLDTQFMEDIVDDISLAKTTVVFAPHHGRQTGKIPNSWLEKLDPQIIVIGEAPSRHLNYYTGYTTITQNRAGDITFDCEDDKVHIYVSNDDYSTRFDEFPDEGQNKYNKYIGSVTVETEYTL